MSASCRLSAPRFDGVAPITVMVIVLLGGRDWDGTGRSSRGGCCTRAWQGPCQEVPHQRGDLGCLVLQREVAGLQRVVFGVRLVGEDLPDDLLWEYLVVGSGGHQRGRAAVPEGFLHSRERRCVCPD